MCNKSRFQHEDTHVLDHAATQTTLREERDFVAGNYSHYFELLKKYKTQMLDQGPSPTWPEEVTEATSHHVQSLQIKRFHLPHLVHTKV